MLNTVHISFKSTFSKSSLLASLLLMTSLLLMVTLLLLMFMLLLSSNALAHVHAVADIHALVGVSSVVGYWHLCSCPCPCPCCACCVTGTQGAVTCVADVVGSTVAVVSCCCRNAWLLLILPRECQNSLPVPEGTFYITPCRKSLPVPGFRLFTFSMPENSGPWNETRSDKHVTDGTKYCIIYP